MGQPLRPGFTGDRPGCEARRRPEDQLRQHGYKDFVYLTRQPQPDGFWVADLRISLPLEKGALVGKEPIDGFDDEISRLTFGSA